MLFKDLLINENYNEVYEKLNEIKKERAFKLEELIIYNLISDYKKVRAGYFIISDDYISDNNQELYESLIHHNYEESINLLNELINSKDDEENIDKYQIYYKLCNRITELNQNGSIYNVIFKYKNIYSSSIDNVSVINEDNIDYLEYLLNGIIELKENYLMETYYEKLNLSILDSIKDNLTNISDKEYIKDEKYTNNLLYAINNKYYGSAIDIIKRDNYPEEQEHIPPYELYIIYKLLILLNRQYSKVLKK